MKIRFERCVFEDDDFDEKNGMQIVEECDDPVIIEQKHDKKVFTNTFYGYSLDTKTCRCGIELRLDEKCLCRFN